MGKKIGRCKIHRPRNHRASAGFICRGSECPDASLVPYPILLLFNVRSGLLATTAGHSTHHGCATQHHQCSGGLRNGRHGDDVVLCCCHTTGKHVELVHAGRQSGDRQVEAAAFATLDIVTAQHVGTGEAQAQARTGKGGTEDQVHARAGPLALAGLAVVRAEDTFFT